MKPLYLLYGAVAALAYYLLKPTKQSPSTLTGEGANLAALNRAAALSDPAQLDIELSRMAGQAKQLSSKIKESPSLGTALGLSPTQIDYIVLPPEKFRTVYGFTDDAKPVSPA